MNDQLKKVRQRRYLARDFDSLRSSLLEYARLYYSDRIRDFSESSLGGVFLDFAAFVGDGLSFYLDHQFSELDYTTAVENSNIERELKNAGVQIFGAAPSIVPITCYIQVPALNTNNTVTPNPDALPIVQQGSVFGANNGVTFTLIEDVDFRKKKSDGTYYAEIKTGAVGNDGKPSTFIMAYSGLAISGQETVESISIGSTFVPFRKITLGNANVSEIVSVIDGYGNSYYQVSSLTHDVVYKNVLNTASDNDIVKDSLKIIPAPFRYIAEGDLNSRRTTLTFGSGNANTLEDDIIPDPSDFAISLPYSKTFSRLPINPQQLLQTKTLGVASTNTTLKITYRYGGGLNHNVAKGNIQNVITLKMFFPNNPTPALAGLVRDSIEISNKIDALGGDDAPSINDLKALIPASKNSQERIVNKEDMLARIYKMPSNFGRVFRASTRSNPNNSLATQLFVVSKNSQGKLTHSPDTLKQNLVKMLNPYRMLSDAVDILDARIVNFVINFDCLIDPTLNKSLVLQSIIKKLKLEFNVKNSNIDQPIIMTKISDLISSTPGVISVNSIKISNVSGIYNNRAYSDVVFDVTANTRQGILFPPAGGIFELKYPDTDIIGKASI